jgi:prepilin-type N-terminal cleavage/methylation domain-containing protein
MSSQAVAAATGICFSSLHPKKLTPSAAGAPLGDCRRLDDAKGFTLLELLLGITLMAMVMATLLVGLRLANRAWQQGEARLRQGRAEEERHTFLVEQISSLVPYAVDSTDPNLPGRFVVLQASPLILRFVTTYASHRRNRSGLVLAEYAAVPGFGGTAIVLRESPVPEADALLRRLVERITPDPETGETVIRYRPFAARETDLRLMTGLQRASFEYLDAHPKGAGGPKWLTQWKSRSDAPYPAAIRLRWEQQGRQEETMIRLRAQAFPEP